MDMIKKLHFFLVFFNLLGGFSCLGSLTLSGLCPLLLSLGCCSQLFLLHVAMIIIGMDVNVSTSLVARNWQRCVSATISPLSALTLTYHCISLSSLNTSLATSASSVIGSPFGGCGARYAILPQNNARRKDAQAHLPPEPAAFFVCWTLFPSPCGCSI